MTARWTGQRGDGALVEKTLRDRLAEIADPNGQVESFRAKALLRGWLHVGVLTEDMSRWDADKTLDRFYRQVLAALGKLTADGTLIKADPDTGFGSGRGRAATWYTPAGWQAAQEREQAGREQARQVARGWQDVHARLAALDLHSARVPYQHPRLSPAQWAALLDSAEAGAEATRIALATRE